MCTLCALWVLAAIEPSEETLAWRRTDRYVAPAFEAFFPEDREGGASLDRLFQSPGLDERSDEEILRAVRSGLRCASGHRLAMLRWLGNRYIWGKSPQNAQAIEIMYHAADFRPGIADRYGTRHWAVYFGLSVVQPKTPAILRTLVDLCMRVDDPNDLDRVAWGVRSQRGETLEYLKAYLKSDDPATRAKAQIVEKIISGRLKAFSWSTGESAKRAKAKYSGELEPIKQALLGGTSSKRWKTLVLVARERIALIMDDSFVAAFAACAGDADERVRNEVARIAGDRWIWSAQTQNPEAIQLMLCLSQDASREVRYNAVYYGLSTVRNKEEKVVRRLLEMAFDDREWNLYQRIVWGFSREREKAAGVLDEYLRGKDAACARAAREVYKDMTGREPNR